MIHHQISNSKANYNSNAVFYTNEIWEHHFHKNLELIYVIKGKVKCTINDTVYVLKKDDFGLCLPYDIHQIEPEENTEYWVLVFSEEYVKYFSKFIKGKTGSGFIFNLDNTTLSFLKEKIIYNASPTVMTMKSCLYIICEEYLSKNELVTKKNNEKEIASQIVDYIEKNFGKHITLKDIAKILGYDYNYMSRYFKNTFNMTFTDFVNLYRLETAIRLIEETDISITEICYESGFKSTRTFNNFFKSKTGLTPTMYKNTVRK